MMAERATRHERGLLDTSVLIDLPRIPAESLPERGLVSTLSLAELSVGPLTAVDPEEKARRQMHLQVVESQITALPFDSRAARAYVRVALLLVAHRRKPHGSNVVDYLIAATALANDLPLYTRDLREFEPLDGLVEVVRVGVN